MNEGSCPSCGTVLEPSSAYCHNCGGDLTSPVMPAFPVGMPVHPHMTPPGVHPHQRYEPPFNPIGHHRALSGMASVVMFVVAASSSSPGSSS